MTWTQFTDELASVALVEMINWRFINNNFYWNVRFQQCCPSLATDHDADVDAEASTPLDAGAGSSVPVDASVGAEGDPRRDRWHKVALELLATERAYVQVLHLLDQVKLGKTR